MHEDCNYYTNFGSIYSRSNPNIMLDEDITIIIDVESGALMKVGHKSDLEEYYKTACKKYIDAGFSDMADALKIITFNVKYPELGFEPDGYNFDIDEICTVLNWFGNCIGDKMAEFLSMSLEDVKVKIRELQEMGF